MAIRLGDSPLDQWFCFVENFDQIKAPAKSSIDRFKNIFTEADRQAAFQMLLQKGASSPDCYDQDLESAVNLLGLEMPVNLLEAWYDSTCMSVNIHFPVDWVQLGDCCRSLLKAVRTIRKHGISCETYHTSIVHKNSLGPMKATPMGPHRGDWDAVLVPSERSIVPLPDDTFAAMLPTFTRETAFVNLFPSLQFNVTWDCMWWMRLVPTGPTSTHILMGFCFPEGSTHQFNFDRVLQQYLKRWEMAVGEDNAISMNQQRGVRSKFRKPGRFSQLEFGTHNMNNWLVSKMLESGGKGVWDPGRRVYVGEGEMFSNDDARMTRAAEEVSRER